MLQLSSVIRTGVFSAPTELSILASAHSQAVSFDNAGIHVLSRGDGVATTGKQLYQGWCQEWAGISRTAHHSGSANCVSTNEPATDKRSCWRGKEATLTELTDYHVKLIASEMTRKCRSDSVEKLTAVLFGCSGRPKPSSD